MLAGGIQGDDRLEVLALVARQRAAEGVGVPVDGGGGDRAATVR